MEEFRSAMVQVDGGDAVMLKPVSFDNRITEAQLEKWLIAYPELAGEPLLILGSQLADFAEDKDRLDILAVDKQGEIVLLELKVDGQFRLTDLQALAYAAGYADIPRSHFPRILQKRWERTGEPEATVERAQEKILAFVDTVDELGDWQPTREVRIKLIAPGYPKRVLHTVKWLGDVYGVPIEAIQVQLFEDSDGRYQLTFERLLPLKSDDAFDLTVRAAEERVAAAARPRRPAILKTLLENRIIQSGDTIWLHPNAFPAEERHLFDPGNPIFQLRLDVDNGKPLFRWRPTPDAPEQLLSPARAWFPILDELLPGKHRDGGSPVFSWYSLEPGGPTLGEIAEENGIW